MQPLLLKDKHEMANMCQPRRMGPVCSFECNNLWLVARYSILVVVGDDVSMPNSVMKSAQGYRNPLKVIQASRL